MREVFTHKEFTRVGHYQTILESEGIPTYIRNASSHNVVADITIPALYPVLCVENEADFDRAVELLRGVYQPEKSDAPDWTCSCGESVPGNFSSCWKCGAEQTGQSAKAVPEAAPEPVVAPASTGAEYHRAVSALRMLLAANIVLAVGFAIAGDSAYEKVDIYPSNTLTPFVTAHALFSVAIEVISALFCFGLLRIGRVVYSLNVVVLVVGTLGSTSGVMHREASVFAWLWSLVMGGVLAMLYFSPASVYFEKNVPKA